MGMRVVVVVATALATSAIALPFASHRVTAATQSHDPTHDDTCRNQTTCGECMKTASVAGPSSDTTMCNWCIVSATCTAWDDKTPTGCDPDECIRAPDMAEQSNCTQTAGDPGVVCQGYVRPPKPPTPSDIWNPACSCEDYCAYKCGNNVTKPTNITVYRLTPYQATGLLNMDTGDVAGDVEFVLSRKDIAAMCADNPHEERCFLAGKNIYGRFTVAIDGQYGPYQFCNPSTGTDGNPNISAFTCCSSFDMNSPGTCNAPTEASAFSPYPLACSCPRNNVSVGKINHANMHSAFGHNESSTDSFTTVLQGFWYSTPSRGECTEDQEPGTGQPGECTWKLVDAVYKNTTCVDGRLDAEIERRGAACFATCPPKGSSGYVDCWLACYFQTVNGNATLSIPPMTKAELTRPWETAMATEDPSMGGCPTCRGKPPFTLGDCPLA
eukprot:m.40054 g.40054  ORF g.40054 m.40054 type:complete len:440 (+) comp5908_c0_seq1:72-1391(+)